MLGRNKGKQVKKFHKIILTVSVETPLKQNFNLLHIDYTWQHKVCVKDFEVTWKCPSITCSVETPEHLCQRF